MHWATKYLGKPWVSGARGPETFDCWGLLRWIYAEQYGIKLPEFVGVDANDHMAVRRLMREQEQVAATVWADWLEVAVPREGDAVAMGGAQYLHHVGLYISPAEGGGVLHCRAGSGVIFQSIAELKSRCGFARIIFYRHALHC